LVSVLFEPRASRPFEFWPVVVMVPSLASVLPFPVVVTPNALLADVWISPWLSTVLLFTTPTARTPVLKIAPGRTFTVTLLLPATAEMELVKGFGGLVSQMTVSLEAGAVLLQFASASRSPAMAASANTRHSDEMRHTPRMSGAPACGRNARPRPLAPLGRVSPSAGSAEHFLWM
jgi:hypothetical protein